ncbi:hypothetical protein FIU84_03025 [Stutzerimonas frequens]|jgi:hypothetical protein|nr:hypothetical protein FIU84_03025 [Stutzerimonas frequens]
MLEALSCHDREQKGVTQHEPNETGLCKWSEQQCLN